LQFCPVSLTLGNELVLCQDPSFTVEYQHNIYWMISEAYMKLFIDDPESFLTLTLPEERPLLLNATERKTSLTPQLEGYCPVALVDRKELVKTSGFHSVKYQARVYSLQNLDAVRKFLRRPTRYLRGASSLPNKRPPAKSAHEASLLEALVRGRGGKECDPAEMLTFMQASVAELICQALVDVGDKRPLYPGKTGQESALCFLAKFLRAKNPINTEMSAQKVRTQLEDFLTDCALPKALAELSKTKDAKEADGTWTSTDQRIFRELCARFDAIFKLSP